MRQRLVEMESSDGQPGAAASFQRLVEIATDWTWVIDPAGNTTFTNKAIRAFLGVQPTEVLGVSWTLFMHPDDRDSAQQLLHQCIAQETGWSAVIIRWLHKDGSIRVSESSGQPIFDSEGALTGFGGIHRDITERTQLHDQLARYRDHRETDKALRESEERYRVLYASMNSGAALYELIYAPSGKPEDYRVLDINPAYEVLTGLSREDVIGRKASEVFVGGEMRYLDVFDRVVTTGESASFDSYYQPWDKHFRLSVFRIEVGKFAITFHEITERKHAEEKMRAERDLLNRIMETSPVPILIADGDAKIIFANLQAVTEFQLARADSGEQVYQTPAWYLADDQGNRISTENWPTALIRKNHQPIYDARYTIVWPDDRKMLVSINGAPLLDESGQVTRIVLVVEDITERERAVEELRLYADRLQVLHDVDQAILQARSPQATAQAALHYVQQLIPCSRITLGVYDRLAQERVLLASLTEGGTVASEGVRHTPDPDWVDRLRQGKPFVVNDLMTATDSLSSFASLQSRGFRSVLSVPLIAQDELIGSLNLTATVSDFFVEDHEKIAVEVADQIAIAIRQARLLEQVEHHAAQLEALRLVTMDITGQLELDSLLRVLIENAVMLLGAKGGGIYLHRPEISRLEKVIDTGVGEIPVGTLVERGELLAGKVWESGQSIVVADYSAWEERPSVPSTLTDQSIIGVPVRWTDDVLGVLVAEAAESRRFSESDAYLLELFASQAAIAIQNSRLYDATRRRVDQLDMLRRITLDVTAQLDLNTLLDALTTHVMAMLQADGGGIYLYRPERDALELATVTGYEGKEIPPLLKRGEGFSGRVWQAGTSLRVDHYSTWEMRATIYDDWSIGAVVGTPIRWGDQFLGTLNVTMLGTSRRIFSEHDAQLLELLAHQAAIAIRNVQLFDDNHRRAHQLDTLRQVTLDITAQLDLDKLLEAIAQHAITMLGADGGDLYLYRPERDVLEWVMIVGKMEIPATGEDIHRGEGISGKVWETEQSLRVEHYSTWDGRLENIGDLDIGATVGVPIRWGDEFLGVINATMSGTSKRTFSDQDLRLLELFASQAAIAIHNVRLFDDNRQRANELDTLRQVTLDITSQLNLDSLLQAIVRNAVVLIDVQSGGITLYRPDRDLLEWVTGENADHIPIGLEILKGEGIAGQVWKSGQSVIVDKLSEWEHRKSGYMDKRLDRVIGVPIQWGGDFLGTIAVARQGPGSRGFSRRDIQLLELLANQAAIAIQNVRLYQEVQRHATTLEERVVERTAELAEAKQQTDTILHHIGDAVVFTDIDANVLFANRAWELVTGYTLNEVIGKNASVLKSENTALETYQQMWKTILGGETWRGVLLNKRKDGTTYDAELTIAPVKDEEGQIDHFVGVMRDVTEQRQLAEMKEQFIADAAHDLGNPVTVLQTSLHLLKKDPSQLDRRLARFEYEINRLTSLVRDLLTISRLDRKAIDPQLQEQDLNTVVRQVVESQSSLATERKLTLSFDAEQNLPNVMIDSKQIERVVVNLVANSLNYTQEGGEVRVRTLQEDDWVVLMVKDSGIGIAPKDLRQIFERFYRADTAKVTADGTGLGLPIVKEIITLHGGKIDVESVVDEGSTFRVFLPTIR